MRFAIVLVIYSAVAVLALVILRALLRAALDPDRKHPLRVRI